MDRKFDIVSLGEILIDFTKVESNNNYKCFQQNPGGAPANVVIAASKLGAKTSFISKVGNDIHGNYLRQILIEEDVNIDNFLVDSSVSTTLAFVDIDNNKERKFSFNRSPGSDTQIKMEDINEDLIINSKILHIGSLSLTHEPSRTTTHRTIEIARKNGVTISYDPNYRDSLWNSFDEAIYHINSIKPDIIKISEEELFLFSNSKDYVEVGNILVNRGVNVFLITLGEKGCYLRTKDGSCLVNGFKSDVRDTTGAGDAFLGAFLYQLSTNKFDFKIDILRAYIMFSNAAASLCVEGIGAIPSLPKLNDIIKRLKKYEETTI